MDVSVSASAGELQPVRRRVPAFARHPALYGVMVAYAALSTFLMLTRTIGITAEHGLLLAAVVISLVASARPFVWDWMPFLFVAVMFEDIGDVTGRIATAVHVLQPIYIEHVFFGGTTAAAWLQANLHPTSALHWWDLVLSSEYLTHFGAPIAMALWLYLRHRAWFGTFVTAYILVMAIGFATTLVYPETPPWLAAQRGVLPPLDRIVVSVLDHINGFGRMYAGADPEPNGAMPALHVAIPALITAMILAVHGGGARYWPWLLYPISMGFAVIYLGEHYLLDVVAGAFIGCACFALTYLPVRGRPPAGTGGGSRWRSTSRHSEPAEAA